VHRDADGEWSVVFETRCRQLGEDLLCGVYEQRPHICRAFDNQTCEVNSDGGRTFAAPQEFLAYLKAERPRVYQAVERRFLPQPTGEPDARPA
jgi:Fe-S-cluster containining protein